MHPTQLLAIALRGIGLQVESQVLQRLLDRHGLTLSGGSRAAAEDHLAQHDKLSTTQIVGVHSVTTTTPGKVEFS